MDAKQTHEAYRRAVEQARNDNLDVASQTRAMEDVVKYRNALDEILLSDREAKEDNEARANAERIAWGVQADAPQGNGPTVEERYRTWCKAGSPGTFRIAVMPDMAADLRACGNDRCTVSYRHDQERPIIEGIGDWTDFAEKPTAADRQKRTSILSTDAGTVYSSYLAPARTQKSLAYHLNLLSGVIASGCEIVQTPDMAPLYLPELSTDAASQKTAEGSPATITNPVLGRTELDAYRYDLMFQVSTEMLQSSIIDMVPELQNMSSRAIATALATVYAQGDGSGHPLGIAGSTTTTIAGVTASGATSFTLGDLITLYQSVIPAYQANGAWLFSTDAFTLLMNLVNDDGTYYLMPSVSAGAADHLLGKPMRVDGFLPAMASTVKGPVLFGSWDAMKIRLCGPQVFEASEEFAFSSFLTTFRGCVWTDSRLGLVGSGAGPIKHMLMKT